MKLSASVTSSVFPTSPTLPLHLSAALPLLLDSKRWNCSAFNPGPLPWVLPFPSFSVLDSWWIQKISESDSTRQCNPLCLSVYRLEYEKKMGLWVLGRCQWKVGWPEEQRIFNCCMAYLSVIIKFWIFIATLLARILQYGQLYWEIKAIFLTLGFKASRIIKDFSAGLSDTSKKTLIFQFIKLLIRGSHEVETASLDLALFSTLNSRCWECNKPTISVSFKTNGFPFNYCRLKLPSFICIIWEFYLEHMNIKEGLWAFSKHIPSNCLKQLQVSVQKIF